VVKIEIGARSGIEPHEERLVRPYVAVPSELGREAEAFGVRAIAPRRTFWEKVSLLHEANHRDGPRDRLARHFYDLWCLERGGVASTAIESPGLFEEVAAHRRIYFRHAAQQSLVPGSVRLVPPHASLPAWARDYEAMLPAMFVGDPPTFEHLMNEMRTLEGRINGARGALDIG
jgi:hypothetical protein